MTNQDFVLNTLRRIGLTEAQDLQARAPELTGTQLNAEADFLPSFDAAVKTQNMLQRKAGFVCRSSAGRVVRLLQPYDSDIYTQQPEELSAQWGFAWSTDPAKALPFISLTTSPYMTGDCCTHEGHVWRSGQDNNTWAPGTVNVSWEDLGPVEEVMS